MNTNFLSLMDESTIKGVEINDLVEVVKDLDNRREFIHVDPDEVSFIVVNSVDNTIPNGIVVPATNATENEHGNIEKNFKTREMKFIKELPIELAKETVNCGVYMNVPGEFVPIPMSVDAVTDIMNYVGLRGTATEFRTPQLMELICELIKNKSPKVILRDDNTAYEDPLGNSTIRVYKKRGAIPKKFDFTLSILRDRDNPNIKKIFSCRSGKYTNIPQKSIIDIIDQAQMMGKSQLMNWEVSQKITSATIGFVDVAEEFSKLYQLRDTIIPCFKISTSDTGDSSLRIAKYMMLAYNHASVYLRLPQSDGERSAVLTRHYGDNVSDRIGNLILKANTDLFKAFREFPEKLAKIAIKGTANAKKALTAAFKAMKLQKSAVVISQDCEEKIIECLCEQLPEKTDLIDCVYTALFASENNNLDITEYQREELRKNALLAVNGDFEDSMISQTRIS